MAITTWLQYADHALAPICRSQRGSNMPIGDSDEIARYVLEGVPPPESRTRHAWIVRLLGAFPALVWVLVAAALYGIWWLISRAVPDGFPEGFALALYLAAIVLALMRV